MAGNVLGSIGILMAMVVGGNVGPATEIVIGSAAALPGDVVFVDVTIVNNDVCIYSMNTVITHNPETEIISADSRLPCYILNSSVFYEIANSPHPPGCAGECAGVAVLAFAIDSHPPDASLLWRCAVTVAPGTAPGIYPIECLRPVVDTCNLRRVEIGCTAGSINVHGCTGDCDRDGATSVAELIRAVTIALLTTAPSECPAADSDGDETISIDELIAGVDVLLNGCALPSAP